MEVAEVHRLVTEVLGVDDDCRDREVLVAAVATVARLQAWLDGRNVRFAAGLAEVAARPARLVAEAARTSARDADRVLDRARTVEAIPALGEALDNGTVSGGHVDAVGRVLRQLEPRHRDALTASAGWLVKLAATVDARELHKALTVELDQLRADDGVSRLERQRRATRLDTWIDDEGMWCLRGRFDPETGLTLHSRLANTVAALFADKTPDDCPFHPLERQAFLRAHALAALTEGRRPRQRRPRDRRRPRSHRPPTRRVTDRRLGAPRRAARRGAAPPVRHRPRPPDHRARRRRAPRPRLPRPGPHHPGGQPSPTPRPARPLQHVRHPRLRHPLRPVPAPPHHLVGTRRQTPTSPTSCPCASDTTTPSTTTAGTWSWPPTGP